MKRKSSIALAAIALLGAGTGIATAAPSTPEARLAKAIEGRVAGKPVNCINTLNVRSSEIIDRTAIVYRVAGDTVYVNRPSSGERSLSRDAIMVRRNYDTQLCRIDTVQLTDRTGQITFGSVALGDFVPYRRISARN